jgi:hypothetical protein
MAVCYHMSDDRSKIEYGYPSEPMLALASYSGYTRISTQHINLKSLIIALINMTKSGMVEAGYRGELVGKLILLFAFDECQRLDIADDGTLRSGCTTTRKANLYPEEEDRGHLKYRILPRPVNLRKFLNVLIGPRLKEFEDSTKSESPSAFEDFEDAQVFFTHFVYLSYSPHISEIQTWNRYILQTQSGGCRCCDTIKVGQFRQI